MRLTARGELVADILALLGIIAACAAFPLIIHLLQRPVRAGSRKPEPTANPHSTSSPTKPAPTPYTTRNEHPMSKPQVWPEEVGCDCGCQEIGDGPDEDTVSAISYWEDEEPTRPDTEERDWWTEDKDQRAEARA